MHVQVTTRFAVEEFFSYKSFHARKKKNRVPTSYLQEDYKIRRWVFLSYESLNSGKQRIFFADKLHTRASTGKPRKPLSLPGLVNRHKKGDVRMSRKEKDQGRQEGGSSEGKIPCALNREFLFFWFTSIWVWKRPVSVEVSAPALLFYEEAMCEGSSGNRLLYAAKAVP